MQRRTFVTATAATAATLAAPMLRAQTLPNGPVRIIVGFAPGGGTDALAAQHLVAHVHQRSRRAADVLVQRNDQLRRQRQTGDRLARRCALVRVRLDAAVERKQFAQHQAASFAAVSVATGFRSNTG